MLNRFRPAGFTLIELLIVVAIIAILAAIAVPNFLEAQTRAKVSRVRADMRTVATGLESHYVDNNKYTIAARAGVTINPRIRRFSPLTTPISYLTSIPQDIFNNDLDDQDARYYIYQDRFSYFAPLPTGGNRYSASAVSIRFMYDYFFLVEAQSAQWLLRSRGPSDDPINTSVAPKFDVNDIYDPSNGTISVGNILRVGPGGGAAGFGD